MNMIEIETIEDILSFSVEQYGNDFCMQFKEKDSDDIIKKTYVDLFRDAETVKTYFIEKKCENRKIALFGEKSYEWIATYFGIVISGNTAVLLDSNDSENNFFEKLNYAKVDFLVSFSEHSFLKQIDTTKYHLLEYDNFRESKNGNGTNQLSNQLSSDSLCTFIFTSGTTGLFKIVELSHKNMLSGIKQVAMALDWDRKNEAILSVLPIFHIYCLCSDILLGILYGVPISLGSSIQCFLDECKFFEPTIVNIVPMLLDFTLSQLELINLKSSRLRKSEIVKNILGEKIKVLNCAGAAINNATKKEIETYGLTIKQGYGMSETASVIATDVFCLSKKGAVGKILDNFEYKIVQNELWVKGNSVSNGYYNNNSETLSSRENDWFKTGDLGYVDEERYFYITGRKKFLLDTSSGENVSPEYLENQLLENRTVKEVIVSITNQVITATFYCGKISQNKYKTTKKELKEIVQKINKKNPRYMNIMKVNLTDQPFDKLPSGKINRR